MLWRVLPPPPSHRFTFKDLYIVFERMDADLDRILKTPQSLTAQHTQVFLFQLLCALAHIHSANVIHRDLKPENVLVSMSTYVAKVCDFGTSKFLGSVNCTYTCTRFYRSPEQILDCSYAFSADMWSFGCVACEVAIGSPFFIGFNS